MKQRPKMIFRCKFYNTPELSQNVIYILVGTSLFSVMTVTKMFVTGAIKGDVRGCSKTFAQNVNL